MPRPIKKQVWNNVDAIGLLNGISIWDEQYQNLKYVRLPDESNIELRHKINNFMQNPIDGTINQQLIKGLANEFNLDSYDLFNVSTFNLTRKPDPVGPQSAQDVFVYYQEPNVSGWTEMTPQMWSQDLENITPTSGFTVWEDTYYTNGDLATKTNNYSKILQVFDELPDMTRLKLVYSIKQLDENDNTLYVNYTDMSNKYDVNDTSFIYRKSYDVQEADLTTMPSVYELSDIPEAFKYIYYNADGTGTTKLYQVRDNIDELYRQRWADISDRQTIWDITLNYSSGTIPSFYDTKFNVTESGFNNNLIPELTGGVNYYNTSLYIKDVNIVIDDDDEEHWYPVMQPGPLYINGKNFYLMENKKSEVLDLTSGSGILPSGVKIQHHTILDTVSGFNTDYILNDYDYDVEYISGIYNPNANIARKRAYLHADMGFDVTLVSGEYNIDYDNNIIYANGINDCRLYWDEVDVPSEVVVSGLLDLNPLNDTNLAYDSYFITVSE